MWILLERAVEAQMKRLALLCFPLHDSDLTVHPDAKSAS